MDTKKLESINKELAVKSPAEVVEWALKQKDNCIITTNFRPYEAALLHLVVSQKPKIDVVWCDTGYNTRFTYSHANLLIELLQLKVDIFSPKLTSAYRDVIMGIPGVDDENHAEFSKQVKLDPFNKAMEQYKPDMWFTNLRKGQTALRDSLGILSIGNKGEWKVSPFYNYSDEELDVYLQAHDLPNETRYYDPTKALDNRECGIHTQG